MSVPALFLDRDGVLNTRLPDDYVTHPDFLTLLPDVPKAVAALCSHFPVIVVVTNQAGIGRGRMTLADLEAVHVALQKALKAAGGAVDRFYACPHRKDAGCNCRKPAVGMAYQAQHDFPHIDFSQSWMVGDSASDIQFGQALGMHTALIVGKTEDEAAIAAGPPPTAVFNTLAEFAAYMQR